MPGIAGEQPIRASLGRRCGRARQAGQRAGSPSRGRWRAGVDTLTEIQFYRASTALPIALPLVATPFALGDPQAALAGFASSLIVAPAYLPFAALCLWGLRKRPAAWYWRASLLAPIAFAVLVLGSLLSVAAIHDGWSGISLRGVWPILGLFLAFGYGYVLLTHAMRLGFRKLGWIRPGA